MLDRIKTETLYETDFCLWLETTVQLLRSREFDRIDYDNLIEAIEDMGNSQKDSLESSLRVLLLHLLKWRFQPGKRSNSWRSSIVEHSLRINKSFQKSPSLVRYFDEVFEETYQDARLLAAVETGLEETAFPIDCPFAREDILNPRYLPDEGS
jgi:Domain of unknown function DUF29